MQSVLGPQMTMRHEYLVTPENHGGDPDQQVWAGLGGRAGIVGVRMEEERWLTVGEMCYKRSQRTEGNG